MIVSKKIKAGILETLLLISFVCPALSDDDKLTASDAQPNEQFGWAVAVEGDVAIVGA